MLYILRSFLWRVYVFWQTIINLNIIDMRSQPKGKKFNIFKDFGVLFLKCRRCYWTWFQRLLHRCKYLWETSVTLNCPQTIVGDLTLCWIQTSSFLHGFKVRSYFTNKLFLECHKNQLTFLPKASEIHSNSWSFFL